MEKVQLNVRISKNTYNKLNEFIEENHWMRYKKGSIVNLAILEFIKNKNLLQKNDSNLSEENREE